LLTNVVRDFSVYDLQHGNALFALPQIFEKLIVEVKLCERKSSKIHLFLESQRNQLFH
jgi:hypothetical protein